MVYVDIHADRLVKLYIKCVLLAQWLTWLTRDHCKFNHIALCLGGHIKVRVPGATIARKNTCVIITTQYYAPSESS